MTDWEKWLKRKSDGLGYMSRRGVFHQPTEVEKSIALTKEIESWQESKGLKCRISAEYSVPVYKSTLDYGTNIRSYSERGTTYQVRKKAMKTYMEIPINIGKETWLIMDWWTAIKHWLKRNKIRIEEKK